MTENTLEHPQQAPVNKGIISTSVKPQPLRAKGLLRSLALLLFLAAILGTGIYQGQQLEFTVLTPPATEASEALSGKTLVVISDLHGHITEKHTAILLEYLKEVKPAGILLAGDMVDRRETYWPEARALMSALPEIAPTFYSFGNHEIANLARGVDLKWLETLGIQILRNETTTLEIEGQRILITGLDDRIGFTSERSYGLMLQHLRNSSDFQILLSHRPEYAQDYAAAGFDLVVSGHAHGGQIRLPLIGPLYAPHQGFFPKWTEGLHVEDMTLHVISRGLGNKVPVPRLFNPREVVLIRF